MNSIRLAVLGSTNGTNMLRLFSAIQQQQLAATIDVVLSNQLEAKILLRAQEHNVPAVFIDAKQTTRDEYDQLISAQLRLFDIDLIVLIGYMRILSAAFIDDWRGKIINVHPSLLPAFAGKMDRQVHQAVLDAGVTESGCTVHLVTELVDAGPIVIQKKCPVFPNDSVDNLRSRVQQLEGEALIEAIQKIMKDDHEHD